MVVARSRARQRPRQDTPTRRKVLTSNRARPEWHSGEPRRSPEVSAGQGLVSPVEYEMRGAS